MPPRAVLPDDLSLPADACGVGRADWLSGRGHRGSDPTTYSSLRACRRALGARAPYEAWVVVDGSHVAPEGDWTEVEAWVRSLRRGHPQVRVVIVGGQMSAAQCAALLRTGAHDVVPARADRGTWRALFRRGGDPVATRATKESVRREARSAQELLHAQRRRVRDEVAHEAEALLQTQLDLEDANSRLSTHMSQLSLLYRLGRDLSTASNWDATLRGFLEYLAEFVGAVGTAVVLRAASGGDYAPRQTYRWDESSWDKVLLNLNRQVDGDVAECLLAPGIFAVARDGSAGAGRIMALPLEHQGVRLGFLLLLYATATEREARAASLLPFLQMVQVVLSEEVAGAQMLDRLREIGAFNTRVLETVRAAIWVCDERGRTIYVNRAARVLLGAASAVETADPAGVFTVGRGRGEERAQPAGVDCEELPEIFLDRRLRLDAMAEVPFPVLFRSPAPFQGTGSLVGRDGEAVPVQVHASPMPGRWGDERWLLVVAEDLREAHRAEAARLRAERLEGLVEMSATLAHEIRNPLMGLSAQAELLAEHLPGDDPRKRYLDVITAEIERIEQTITRMLQFVRPYAPQRRMVNVDGLVRDCIALARPRAMAANVAVAAEGEAAGAIDVDPVQIKQVLLNLVINAIDAVPDGGHVVVRLRDRPQLVLANCADGVRRLGAGLEIVVEDDGPGFGDIAVEALFRPFFTTKNTGTGLGLAISQKVVTAHGGEIRAERDGDVTRMRVLLPRQNTAGARARAEEAS